jgi:LAO/AO transport system kinase
MKAGLLEVADVFVVNKADREGADRLFKELNLMVHEGLPADGGAWASPVLKAVATEGKGIPEILDAADKHLAWLRDSGAYAERRRRAATAEIDGILRDRLLRTVMARVPAFDRYAGEVGERQYDPYTAVERILGESGLG